MVISLRMGRSTLVALCSVWLRVRLLSSYSMPSKLRWLKFGESFPCGVLPKNKLGFSTSGALVRSSFVLRIVGKASSSRKSAAGFFYGVTIFFIPLCFWFWRLPFLGLFLNLGSGCDCTSLILKSSRDSSSGLFSFDSKLILTLKVLPYPGPSDYTSIWPPYEFTI